MTMKVGIYDDILNSQNTGRTLHENWKEIYQNIFFTDSLLVWIIEKNCNEIIKNHKNPLSLSIWMSDDTHPNKKIICKLLW